MKQWSLTTTTGDGSTKDLVMTASQEMILLSYIIASTDFTGSTSRSVESAIVYVCNSADTDYFKANHGIRTGGFGIGMERNRFVTAPGWSLILSAGDKVKIVTSDANIICTVKGWIC